MASQNITFSLPDDEYNALKAESLEPPYNGVLADACRQIIRGRYEMVIQSTTDVGKLKSYYEGKIELLEATNEKLLDRLSASDRSSGLSGLDHKEKKVGSQISDAIKRERSEWEQAALKEKYDALKLEHEKLKGEYDELEEEVDELRKTTSTDNRIQSYMEPTTNALGILLDKLPGLKARVEQNGLGSILGGGAPVAIGAGNLDEQSQDDLNVGRFVRNEFAGERYKLAIDTIRYMRDNPGVLHAITNSDKFRVYMAQRQPQAA